MMRIFLTVLLLGVWLELRSNAIAEAAAVQVNVAAKDHWSFQTPTAPVIPNVKNRAWPRTDIDRFLLAKLEANDLQPLGQANRLTLIRRATYDLTGLPPTPKEIDAFLNDNSPQAFAAVVNRLLASPRYGERWGRHWLDVVRYADTAGETADFPIDEAWRYRNYVINAFNRDTPFDQFVREQLAGDILAKADESLPPGRFAELITATGYLAISRRHGFDARKDHYLTIEDTIDTIGKSFLGLTIACARCHDHKYDPISAKDYYGLYGIFASTRYSFPGSESSPQAADMVPLSNTKELLDRMEAWNKEKAELEKQIAEAKKQPDDKKETAIQSAEKKLAELMENQKKIAHAYGAVEGDIVNEKLHKRGDPKTTGGEVPRKNINLLGGQKVTGGSGRLQLANWIANAGNPLTARVIVNRIWLHHFGRGLVSTPNDFGTQGQAPTHPGLLDWLAVKFVQSGWSIKDLHRLIMNSASYQAVAAAGPGQKLYGAFRPRRLSAEELRDTLLALGLALDCSTPAGHPFPEKRKFTQHTPFRANYENNHRSVFLMTQRIQRRPIMALFDGADSNASTGQRRLSNVPTQALYFMNNEFMHAQANALAKRLAKLSPDSTRRIQRAHRLALGRPATEREVVDAAGFITAYSAASDEAKAWDTWCRVLLSSNEFLYVN